jgi:thymidylate synthase (FAD)
VRIICDRGVTHELVRHRLASFSQESTRYANYGSGRFGGEITVIRPCFWPEDSAPYALWRKAAEDAERAYMELLKGGATPQQARTVLPNCLKTEIVVTCNIREWRHIFALRCDVAAHPQMREIALPLLARMHARAPELLADLFELHEKAIREEAWKG